MTRGIRERLETQNCSLAGRLSDKSAKALTAPLMLDKIWHDWFVRRKGKNQLTVDFKFMVYGITVSSSYQSYTTIIL